MRSTLRTQVWENNQRTYWMSVVLAALCIVLLDIWYHSRYGLLGDSLYLLSGAFLYWLAHRQRLDSNLAITLHLAIGMALVATESHFPAEWLSPNADININREIYSALSTMGVMGVALFGGLRGLLLGLFLHIALTQHISVMPIPIIDWLLGALVGAFGLTLHHTFNRLVAAQTHLEQIAFHDPLTQLPNRHALQSEYPHYLAIASRQNVPLLLTMWDLDKLKQINDLHGHLKGDLHLKRFSEILKQNLRVSDVAFRIGGDEFCGLHLELFDGNPIAQRLRQQFPEVSVGWVECTHLSLEEALTLADRAMYEDKKMRRSQLPPIKLDSEGGA